MEREIKELLIKLIEKNKIASLGTSINDIPYVSMVTYGVSENLDEFYILISQLAKHTKNISQNKNIGLMICQPETDSQSSQTLARLSITGTARLIEKGSHDYTLSKQQYLKKNIDAEMYFNLGDFNLFRIEIEEVRFVAGFAKTFNLSKTSLQNLKIK